MPPGAQDSAVLTCQWAGCAVVAVAMDSSVTTVCVETLDHPSTIGFLPSVASFRNKCATALGVARNARSHSVFHLVREEGKKRRTSRHQGLCLLACPPRCQPLLSPMQCVAPCTANLAPGNLPASRLRLVGAHYS